MKRTLHFFLTILLLSTAALAQDLYMPRNVKAAYESGTRSFDGKPAQNYFQNKSKHDIRISVSPPGRTVTGTQTIEFTNNGPNPLPVLVFRFELNVHAPEAMRERPVGPDELAPPIEIDEYSEDGTVREWNPLIKATGMTFNAVRLQKPVLPGETRSFGFKWHYTLVNGIGREGAIDPTTFYLAYFYPRVAVYDDVSGWDTTPHMLSHEFYAEFNDYDVEVTVPKNFVVWGTGDLVNIDEVLQPAYAKRLRGTFESDDIVTIATPKEIAEGKVTRQAETVTWKWRAEHVADVAYGLSDHYKWDASSVVVDKASGRRASTQAAYDLESRNFAKMVEYIKSSLEFGSFDTPGVPYPYPKMTIFRGFADMEYPMMANDSEMGNPQLQEFVAAHEILHTYFPFFMGINERRYSFMEEGWTTAFEYLYNSRHFEKGYADTMFKNFRVRGWITSDDQGADIPIMTAEDSMTGEGYGNNKYGRSALGYLALRDLLGEKEFNNALREFIRRWNGKHPIPWDMFYSFNTSTGQDLNWFWNAWFFSPGYIDIAFGETEGTSEGVKITLENRGGFPAPFDLTVKYKDGSSETIHKSPSVWKGDLRKTVISINKGKEIDSMAIDGGIWMDANPEDNVWEALEMIGNPSG